jgi:hypothetical protein
VFVTLSVNTFGSFSFFFEYFLVMDLMINLILALN